MLWGERAENTSAERERLVCLLWNTATAAVAGIVEQKPAAHQPGAVRPCGYGR